MEKPTFQIDQVWTKGDARWRVIRVDGDRAVLQSCSSSWATTIPLTMAEWNDDGRWMVEQEPRS